MQASDEHRRSSLGRADPRRARAAVAVLATCAAFVAACGSKAGGATADKSSAPAPSASASAPPNAAPDRSSGPTAAAPTGTGIAAFTPVDKGGCDAATADIATYLQRGELTLADRGDEIAVSWLVQLRDHAQIGFAGYDGKTKRLARDRSIGSAREHAPKLFSSKAGWIVAWFDDDGLAYGRPKWEAELRLTIDHLPMVKDVPPEDLALAANEDGSLVAVSPFGTSGDQLTLFSFGIEGKNAEAIGFTKHAKKPHHPVIASDGAGYAVAWVEADGHVQSTRFDPSGKESGGSDLLLGPGERNDFSLVPTATGFQLTWAEGENVVTLGLTKDAIPDGAPHVVGKGKWPAAAAAGGTVYLAYVGDADGKPEQMLVTKLATAAGGALSTAAVRVSDGVTGVKDPPSVGVVGDRVAVFYTEAMSTTMSTKRAILRTIAASCVK